MEHLTHHGAGAHPVLHHIAAVDLQHPHCIAAMDRQIAHPLLEGLYLPPAGQHRPVLGVGVQIGVFQPAQPPQKGGAVLSQRPQGGRVPLRQRGVVDGHQAGRPLYQCVGRPEPAQDIPGQPGAPLVVAVKVHRPIGRHGAAEGLGQIVEKGRPAQHLGPPFFQPLQIQRPHRHRGVLPDIIAVPPPRLVAADAGQDLRDHPGQHLAVLGKHLPCVGAGQQLVQLGEAALGRNAVQRPAQLAGRPGGGFLQGKAQLGRKPHRPQNPQGILTEPRSGVSHTADQTGSQVCPAAVQVHQPRCGGIGHGVDGKIPPGQVLPQLGHKEDPIGVAAIGIARLHPVGGDLVDRSLQHQGHGAVLFPGQDLAAVRENRLGLVGGGIGADVPVAGPAAQQAVPDTAPHHIGRMSRPVQGVQQHRHRGGKRNGDRSPLPCRPCHCICHSWLRSTVQVTQSPSWRSAAILSAAAWASGIQVTRKKFSAGTP